MENKMKERIYTKDGMRQIIDTGCKIFDKQVGAIVRANVLDNCMTGMHIRSWYDTGDDLPYYTFRNIKPEPGYLTRFDLRIFTNIPSHVEKAVKDFCKDRLHFPEGIVLYQFFHHSKIKGVVLKHTHGYIITTRDHKISYKFNTGTNYERSEKVLKVCSEYILE
jgi:hypothetical protein